MSSSRVDLTKMISPPSMNSAAKMQPSNTVAVKKVNVPNISENDKSIVVKLKSLKSFDLTKGTKVRIKGCIVLGSNILKDENEYDCVYENTIIGAVGSERNTLVLGEDTIFGLNPN